MKNYIWQAGRFQIDLSQPKIMGVVNMTPDSFSDGGNYSFSIDTALAYAEKLLKEGADILDVGGESTRPGSVLISPEEEWIRVCGVLEQLAAWDVPISLDTRHAYVMEKALASGCVDIINDVQGLTDTGAVDLLAKYFQTGICLMHMKGLPASMQDNPEYRDVVQEVADYLIARTNVCKAAGIDSSRIVIDPGFGFGKSLMHNTILLRNLHELIRLCGQPLLVGVSRKRMIGELTGQQDPKDRMAGSVAAVLASVSRGAQIVRVHDVRATVDALKVWHELGVCQAE